MTLVAKFPQKNVILKLVVELSLNWLVYVDDDMYTSSITSSCHRSISMS